MSKIIIVILIAIAMVGIMLNAGGNTGVMENTLDLAKSEDSRASLLSVIELLGNAAYSNIWIENNAFTGEIEQPCSSATDVIKSYVIKNTGSSKLSLKYDASKITVEGTAPYTPIKIVDANIPKVSRDLSAATTTISGTGPVHPLNNVIIGIPPVIKETTNSATWIDFFLFHDNGLALERMTEYADIWVTLKTAPDKQLSFMKWLLGNGTDPVWNEYKVDRIIGMKQINSKALTGLDTMSKDIAPFLDNNRVYLYYVESINQTSLAKPKAGLSTSGVTVVAAKQDKFLLDLSNHVNQMLGGKIVLIPNSDSNIIYDTDGNPYLKLN